MSDWDKDRKEYRKGYDAVTGEAGWTLWKGFTRVILPLMLVGFLIGGVGYALGWFGEAAEVAREEFGPRASLKKYEWFIDQASRIDKMDADVAAFEQRLQDVEGQYASYGADRAKWPPDVRMQYQKERSTARDDLLAIVSQRNNLVREYNAASEKFNWAPYDTKDDRPKPRYDERVLPQ